MESPREAKHRTSSSIRCFSCCGANGVADDEPEPVYTMGVEEEFLLIQREPPHRQRSKKSHCFCCCCCLCCCLLIGLFLASGISTLFCVNKSMHQEGVTLPEGVNTARRHDRVTSSNHVFTLADMPVVDVLPEEQWATSGKKLSSTWQTAQGYSFGYSEATSTPRLLYEGSKVEGVFDKIPRKLRGVYWKKGDLLPEVLTVMQYGKWFEKEKVLLLPNAPWTSAWWDGHPRKTPSGTGLGLLNEGLYSFENGTDDDVGRTEPDSLDTTTSLSFEPCPSGAECSPGEADLSFARVMTHEEGDLSENGTDFYDGHTLEEMQSQDVGPSEGSLYFRRVELFCGFFSPGTGFSLVKIIDADGEKIEPYFSEYEEFMTNRSLVVWAGLPTNHQTAEEDEGSAAPGMAPVSSQDDGTAAAGKAPDSSQDGGTAAAGKAPASSQDEGAAAAGKE